MEASDHLGIDYFDPAPPRPLKPQISYASRNSTAMEPLGQCVDLVRPIRDMTWYLGMPTVCRPVSRAHRHRNCDKSKHKHLEADSDKLSLDTLGSDHPL